MPALTALDNMIAPVLPYRSRVDHAARTRELIDAMGLAGREPAFPAQISGGQQQRVAIAGALMGEPGVPLADEPTGNLDSTTAAQIFDLLFQLCDERRMTILLATHEQHIAARWDRLIRFGDRRMVEDLDLTGGEEPGGVSLDRASRLRL
jgi:putative ABC transport system ATP-binding protein